MWYKQRPDSEEMLLITNSQSLRKNKYNKGSPPKKTFLIFPLHQPLGDMAGKVVSRWDLHVLHLVFHRVSRGRMCWEPYYSRVLETPSMCFSAMRYIYTK
jgi:hypothetical protein